MIYMYSRLALWSTLALAALVGCKNPQRDEPAEHPGAEAEQEPEAEAQPSAPETAETPATPAPTATDTPGTPSTPGTPGTPGTTDPDLFVITVTAIDIDTKLAELCGLSGSSVFFKYNSAQLQPEAKERLQQIANCALTGAAKDKDLLIVGRTDPVGSDEYNKRLGTSRAESVSKYLRDLGVKRSRVDIVSQGETGAIRDPYGWPINRRVTIRLQ
jgi:outer membrane protein OmpA-like peptidoglycan-associated protein